MSPSYFNKGFFDSSGFTLAELAVVVLISGFFLGFALMLPGAYRQKLAATASVLAEDIRLVQQLNANQDAVYTILFDCPDDLYLIHKGARAYKKVKLPHGVDLVATNFDGNKLRFNTRGDPIGGGHLSLRDKKGNTLYVIVAAVTGRVRVDGVPPP